MPSWPVFDSQEPMTKSYTGGIAGRYEYARVRVAETSYFYKHAHDPVVGQTSIAAEIAWREVLEQVGASAVRGTAIIATQLPNDILTEYIDAPLLATVDQLEAFRPHLARWAVLIAAIDRYGLGRTLSLPAREWPRVTAQHLSAQWDEWFDTLGERSPPDRVMIFEAARRVTDRAEGQLQSCIQMGDFVPWHFFTVDEEWVCFDAEHAHHEWPRFYDLAYCYTRLYTRGSPALARELMKAFFACDTISQDAFWPQFFPVLMSRAVGVHCDALLDYPRVDYRAVARHLLDLCLAGNQEALW